MSFITGVDSYETPFNHYVRLPACDESMTMSSLENQKETSLPGCDRWCDRWCSIVLEDYLGTDIQISIEMYMQIYIQQSDNNQCKVRPLFNMITDGYHIIMMTRIYFNDFLMKKNQECLLGIVGIDAFIYLPLQAIIFNVMNRFHRQRRKSYRSTKCSFLSSSHHTFQTKA